MNLILPIVLEAYAQDYHACSNPNQLLEIIPKSLTLSVGKIVNINPEFLRMKAHPLRPSWVST